MLKKIFCLTFLGLSINAFSYGIELGELSYRGNGCSQGTLSAFKDELGESIYLSASKYFVELSAGKKLDRKTCQIALPIKLALDKKLVLKKVYLAGAQLVNEGDLGKLSAELFLAGDTGLKLEEDLDQYGHLFVKASEDGQTLESKCGEEAILRLNSSIFLSSTQSSDSAVYMGLGEEGTFAKLELEVKDCADVSEGDLDLPETDEVSDLNL